MLTAAEENASRNERTAGEGAACAKAITERGTVSAGMDADGGVPHARTSIEEGAKARTGDEGARCAGAAAEGGALHTRTVAEDGAAHVRAGAVGDDLHARANAPGAAVAAEVYDELAYQFDGSLEGLLTAVFASYARHENPTDVLPEGVLQARLGQHVVAIETDRAQASRVRSGFRRACGPKALAYATRASLSDEPGAATAVYRYIRHGMHLNAHRGCASCRRRKKCAGATNPAGRPGQAHCPKVRGALTSDLSHPAVSPVFKLARSVFTEQEHLLQFARFEHLQGGLWFARCNPKANVLPLVMDHFAGRFNTQPFLIYDEVHHLAGVYEGAGWSLVRTDGLPEPVVPDRAAEEAVMQHAWRRFYRAVTVESRYNPELRQRLMPKRFWRNLTEMQEELPALARSTP